MKKVSVFLGLFLVLVSCSDQDDVTTARQTVCNSESTEFQQIYSQIAGNPLSLEQISIDTEVHGYTFMISSEKTICRVGYQSNHTDAARPYTIEIVNEANNTVIYSGSHVFSQTAMSYVSLNATVTLQPNVFYTIRRIQTDWGGNAFNVCGKILRLGDGNFGYASFLPLNTSEMTITGAVFYDNGSLDPTINSYVLPCLDIVFES
ncbi:hypothetical protein ABGT15_09890 [Flavobacterium enshiense]|uniref:hypothetical protein n=1 Tax=Flavobacterium enshiense TaxID=1341165 RepID=UPI00345C9D02